MKLLGQSVKKEQALKAAQHQAGHALLAIVKGMTFHSVRLSVTGGNVTGVIENLVLPTNPIPNPVGNFTHSDSTTTAHRRRMDTLIVTLAGLAGERSSKDRPGSVCRTKYNGVVDGKHTWAEVPAKGIEDDLAALSMNLTGQPIGHADGIRTDERGAMSMDKKFGYKFDEPWYFSHHVLDWGLQNAHKVIRKYTSAYKVLVDTLLQKGSLSFDEFKSLSPANANADDEVKGHTAGREANEDTRTQQIYQAFKSFRQPSNPRKTAAKREMDAAFRRLVTETKRLQGLASKTDAEVTALDELRSMYRAKQSAYELMLQPYHEDTHTAYHEAAHAIVAHALGHRFKEEGITIVPSFSDNEDEDEDNEGGYLGAVWIWRHDIPVVDNVAIHLAGGMATMAMMEKTGDVKPLRSEEDRHYEVSGDMGNTVFHLIGDDFERMKRAIPPELTTFSHNPDCETTSNFSPHEILPTGNFRQGSRKTGTECSGLSLAQ